MLNRNLLFIFPLSIFLYMATGCKSFEHKITLASGEYDLNNPSKLVLGDALAEISGISFYDKDSSVFAISDETGLLYKIYMKKGFLIKEWPFDKKRDYEDVMLKDSSFYVLESNGNIEKLNFAPHGDTVFNRRTVFPGNNTKKNEFESLYYDEEYKGFVMICKDCEDDDSQFTTAWLYDPVSDKYTSSIFKIALAPIAEKIGAEKIKFRPSAAAVNPITKDIWIVSSTNEIIVVIDHKGNMKEVYTLNPKIFNKPEGITFTPWGDLLVSNETIDKYSSATLLIFKPKKKS